MKARFPVLIIVALYCIFFGAKFAPDEMSAAARLEGIGRKQEDREPLKPFQEKAGYIIFFGVTLCLLFQPQIGKFMRRLGTSSLDLAYVACGRASAFFETILLPWDYAAGLLLVEEAGGKVTAMDGSPVKVPENSSIVATNGLVHNEILEIINDGNDFIR